VLYVYIFAGWALVIGLAALAVERTHEPPPPGPDWEG
jgi:hypothetical protein